MVDRDSFMLGFVSGGLLAILILCYFSVPYTRHQKICIEYGIAEYDNTTGVFKMKPKPEN